MNQRKRLRLGSIPQAGQLAENLLSRWRQTAQLRRHEICYVVGIALGANAIQVPGLRRDQQFALLIAENSSVSCPPAARNDGGD